MDIQSAFDILFKLLETHRCCTPITDELRVHRWHSGQTILQRQGHRWWLRPCRSAPAQLGLVGDRGRETPRACWELSQSEV